MEYLANLPAFIKYFVTALALFAAAGGVYVHLTPHAEFKLIAAGNDAAAIALAGALIGLALPIASTVVHSVDFVDMVLWSGVAALAQGLVYALCARLVGGLSEAIQRGVTAPGVALAGISVGVGIINAACVS